MTIYYYYYKHDESTVNETRYADSPELWRVLLLYDFVYDLLLSDNCLLD